jgi:outer membrane protein OmpA-like peptidoglycan-associated protein
MTNAELMAAFAGLGLEAVEVERGVVVYLPSIYLFAFNSDSLSGEALTRLLDVASVLNRSSASSRAISIEGHTDAVGSDDVNMALSLRRARAVAGQLSIGGVAAERMSTRGFGKTVPRAPNTNVDGSDNPDGRALNRRVELVITNTGP